VRNLASTAQRVSSSSIAVAEVSAAFHRKFREGAIDSAVFKALNGQFAHDRSNGLWTLVPVTEAVLDAVVAFYRQANTSVFLRSLDALHIATARLEKFDRIYSNDRHLLNGCVAAGLQGINPLP